MCIDRQQRKKMSAAGSGEAYGRKNANHKRKRNKMPVWVPSSLMAALVLGCFLEFLLKFLGLFRTSVLLTLGAGIVTLWTCFGRSLYQFYKNNPKYHRFCKNVDRRLAFSFMLGKDIIKAALSNGIIFLLFFSAAEATVIVACAWAQVGQRSINAIEGFCEPLDEPSKEIESIAEQETPQDEQSVSLINEEKNLKSKHSDEQNIRVNAEISDQEKNLLLFMEGEYMIPLELWAEQGVQQVTAFLLNLENEQKVNDFDSQADQKLKNQIAEASCNDTEEISLLEKVEILNIRLNAYALLEKRSLAALISEDFHFCALENASLNEDKQQAVDFYFLSLKWLYEQFKYGDISEEERGRLLKSVRFRYNDIMTYSELGTDQWLQAQKMVKVFDQLLAE